MNTKAGEILVAGGGIGGLATALALGRKNRRVRVLEQAPQFGGLGYGIQLGPNAFEMFERLGIANAVLDICDFPPSILMLDAFSGEKIACIPTGTSFRARFKHAYAAVHRGDLHDVLLDACKRVPGIQLEPSTSVARFEDAGDHVLVETEDGRMIRGTALIGADGLRSRVRAQLLNDGDPRMVGFVAHRTIVFMREVPAGVPRNEVVMWAGPGYHIVHYPLRRGTLFNVVAVFRTPTYAEKGDAASYRAELQQKYDAAHPAMKAVLAIMDLDRRWAIADRHPMRCWSKRRVTLLGDAAHPTLQSLAQGACMAIEDGVCLAELIDVGWPDPEAPFQRYQRERFARTARVQLESRFLWEVYHAAGAARERRRASFAGFTERDMFECVAWLYDGFALPSTSDSSRRPATSARAGLRRTRTPENADLGLR